MHAKYPSGMNMTRKLPVSRGSWQLKAKYIPGWLLRMRVCWPEMVRPLRQRTMTLRRNSMAFPRFNKRSKTQQLTMPQQEMSCNGCPAYHNLLSPISCGIRINSDHSPCPLNTWDVLVRLDINCGSRLLYLASAENNCCTVHFVSTK